MKLTVIMLAYSLLLFSCNEANQKEIIKEEVEAPHPETNQVPDGDFIQKYPSGAIQIKGKMLANQRDGLWTAYYENGAKQSESTYQNGVLHGRTASFYKNGQVHYIGYFLGGKKDGKWEFYSEEGVLDKSEIYSKGKLSEKK
ncbi:MAG: hypothetical protein N4A35_09780 [Flavobacteriales bacterium]|jgi:antitoxin component YwqK of YwqJK toxin-antitoxin module|nr:hypothetical protein [Flavobacteriales bacterium]